MSAEAIELKIMEHTFVTPAWDHIAAAQKDDVVQPQLIIESELGTVWAFRDRDNVAKPMERKIFVVRGDDNNVYLFSEDGTVLDEPDAFTPGGVQRCASVSITPQHTQANPFSYLRL